MQHDGLTKSKTRVVAGTDRFRVVAFVFFLGENVGERESERDGGPGGGGDRGSIPLPRGSVLQNVHSQQRERASERARAKLKS